MIQCLTQITWLVATLLALPGPLAALPCLRLAGVVQDYTSHQPLEARLYLKTSTGRSALGSSTAGTGRFMVGIACPAMALIVERSGYRSQTLRLNLPTLPTTEEPVEIIVPLVAVDPLGKDKPYLQTEQTYFEQVGSGNAATRPQHNVFLITDALSGKVLSARTCFFFTSGGQQKCLDADAAGHFSLDFSRKDIVAMEVVAPGYQTYQGNLIVDELDGRQLQHTIRLMRELTIVSVRLDAGAGGCELRPPTAGQVVRLTPASGQTNVLIASDVVPGQYDLMVFDLKQAVRERTPLTVRVGLNVVNTTSHVTVNPTASTVPVAAPPVLPDPLPMLYFEQGSFAIMPSSKAVLRQTAAYLLQNPAVRVRLAGHTDREGEEPLNRALSENRAKVVSNFLFEQGIPNGRMDIVGYGSRFPVAPSDSEENKAKNRRVQMKLIANQN